jgi:hypothetical protein
MDDPLAFLRTADAGSLLLITAGAAYAALGSGFGSLSLLLGSLT